MKSCFPILASLMTSLPLFAGEWIPLDNAWRFHLGEPAKVQATVAADSNRWVPKPAALPLDASVPATPEAALPGTSDSAWRLLDLPHDWSIEQLPDPKAPGAGNVGFFPTGSGWYRRSFEAPKSWQGRLVSIRFDGVYMNATVWLNGHKLGTHPYGYTPADFDLTPHLVPGGMNTLAVHVDNSAQPNTRWYSGSGIYRHVRLHVCEPLHVPVDGLRVSTLSLDEKAARLRVVVDLRNASPAPAEARLELVVRSPSGQIAASSSSRQALAADESREAVDHLAVEAPLAWSPSSPSLYRIEARLIGGSGGVDSSVATFGIRTVSVSADRGFELNGRPLKLLGGNVHHDNGPLGAASFDQAEERKAALLRQAGFNAVRCSHNPPAPAFLDACDRLGLLVLDEAFDGWASKKGAADYGLFFREWSQRDVAAMVRRDFNHPSVVMWSIGNETYERGSSSGRAIAKALAERIRSLDTSRPVTIGLNDVPGNWKVLDGLFVHLDAAGYNYELKRHAEDHTRIPGRVMLCTESYQNEAFANWLIFSSVPYVLGDFVWSAIDYLGESGIGRVWQPGAEAVPHWKADMWPWHGATCGDIDLTGWRKPASHYRQIVWDSGAKLYAAVRLPAPGDGDWSLSQWAMPPSLPSWTWPGREGKLVMLEVFSRHEAVRVRVNGRLVGEAPTGQAREFKALIPLSYEPGLLEVAGLAQGKEVETFSLTSAGPACRLRLSPEQRVLAADPQGLFYCSVELTDDKGTLNPGTDLPLTISVSGPARLLACASGNLSDNSGYGANPRSTHQGRALIVLRSSGLPGRIKLVVSAPGMESANLELNSK